MSEKLPRRTSQERITRLLDAGDLVNSDQPGAVLYAHTVLCQTGLPYRNPGDVREWERANGSARLEIIAGKAMHSVSGEFVKLGLPYGSKPRLIEAEATMQHSSLIRPGGSQRPRRRERQHAETKRHMAPDAAG